MLEQAIAIGNLGGYGNLALLDQVFQVRDLGTVGLLIILEALLSADNALILAIIVRHLPKDEQRKALMYGIWGAFVLRLVAIIFASSLISYWWLQAIGAIYLLWLPIKHFVAQAQGHEASKYAKKAGFWQTVIYVELTDVAFAIDSVLVAVAIEPHREKLWVVYLGAVLGIVLLRWAAGVFLRILEKYPVLDHLAYILVGWAGVKLAMHTGHTFAKLRSDQGNPLPFELHSMPPAVFWGGLALIVIVGGLIAVRKPKLEEPIEDPSQAADQIDDALDEDNDPPATQSR